MTISRTTRCRVLDRDEQQCRFSLGPGLRCPTRDDLTLHHIVAVRDGGSNRDTNLVTLCGAHHRLIESHVEARYKQSWGAGTRRLAHTLRSKARGHGRFKHHKDCTPGNCVYSCEVGWR